MVPNMKHRAANNLTASLKHQFSPQINALEATVVPQQITTSGADNCQAPQLGAPLPIAAQPHKTTPFLGDGVRVAVIDTGASAPGVQGDRFHCHLHGTVVASVVHAVAPGAEVEAILHSEHPHEPVGTVATLVRALDRATEHGASIINVSMVACQDTLELRDAVQRVLDTGALLVAPTGNSGQCASEEQPFPASLPGVLAVGALDDAEIHPAAYAAHSEHAAIFAHGGPVSAELEVAPHQIHTIVGGPEPFVGTSFAAPQVAGAAARIKEILPEATATELETILLASSIPGGEVPQRPGEPLRALDVQRAVDLALHIRNGGDESLQQLQSMQHPPSSFAWQQPVHTQASRVERVSVTTTEPAFAVVGLTAIMLTVIWLLWIIRTGRQRRAS